MENQHQKISGYRDFNQETVNLINQAKALEAQVLALHQQVAKRLQVQVFNPEQEQQVEKAQAFRWLNIGRTNIEQGFMATVRAIAQPQPLEVK